MSNYLQPTKLEDFATAVSRPFFRFFKVEALGGIVLLISALAAIIIANSPLSDWYHHFWETRIGLNIGVFKLDKSLHHWINDGLMTIFFFLVGLELKREFLVGELKTIKQASLPLAAAVGGMVVPALFFVAVNYHSPQNIDGWGIPMATDIAFALGCLALLGRGVPPQIIVFLTALAIVDDLGGILVIAIFYTEQISYLALIYALFFISISFVINKLGVTKTMPYVLIGIAMWLALLKSGVHATVGGVLLALTIPAVTRINYSEFVKIVERQIARLTCRDKEFCLTVFDENNKQSIIHKLVDACFHVEAPLQRIEHSLHPWVTFLIMPVFAFANAGVTIDFSTVGEVVFSKLALGIIVGLVVGKQIGVFGFTWLVVKAKFAVLPKGVNWGHIYGVSWLSGIGFTMSLFITTLAFKDPAFIETAKIAILIASVMAGAVGYFILKKVIQKTVQ